jgi:biopolymer transport protein ExbD
VVKPSIFSKDYEQKMRRRKKRITLTFFISVILIIFVVVYIKGVFKNFGTSVKNTKSNVVSSKNEPKNSNINKPQKSEGYDIQLSDGTTDSAIYETKNNEKTFRYLSPTGSNTYYDISPSGKSMVVFDSKAQSIILMDISGNKQDITNNQYVSTSGTEITKTAQLSAQPDYIWCSSPKFINEDTSG